MIPPNPRPTRTPWPRRRILILAAAAALALVLGFLAAAWAAGGGTSTPPAEPPEVPSLDRLETTAPAVAGDPSGSAAEQAAWAVEQIDADLAAFGEAFAAGDRAVWIDRLAAGQALSLSADASELEEQVGLYFDNMTAMAAANLEWVLLSEPEPSTVKDLSFEARVGLRFCLAPTDPAACTPSEVDYLAAFDLMPDATEPDLGLSRLTINGATAYRPQPWEVAPLKVAVRDRVLVAATAGSAYDPLDYVEQLQAAAAGADRFALTPVASYPVFLASDMELNTWYGGYDMGASLGYAASTLTDTTAADTVAALHLVLAADRADEPGAEHVPAHEAVHVATLQGATVGAAGSADTWWLMEGIAEYGAAGDELADYRTADTAAYTAAGGCTGDLTDLAAAVGDQVSGAYGCAYLAVRSVIDTYGLEAFLAFFEAGHNRGGDLEQAAQETLGVAYADVLDGAAAAIAAAA